MDLGIRLWELLMRSQVMGDGGGPGSRPSILLSKTKTATMKSSSHVTPDHCTSDLSPNTLNVLFFVSICLLDYN